MLSSPATKSDREGLSDFLGKSSEVFRGIVEARHVLIRQTNRDLLLDAWDEVKQVIEQTQHELKDPYDRDELEMKLGAVGLSGTQLKLKLASFENAYNRFVKRGTKKLLDIVLRIINNLLGSLAGAIPGVDIIKEFKDTAEAEMDDSDPV